MSNTLHASLRRVTAGGILLALGIVFGDIGTSPLYVLKAIVGERVISRELILGGLSCIFWTLTIQTTIKYVLMALHADNRGEGGIMALYALVRRKRKWLFIPTIIGGSALLADGIITPSISVTSAVEGLRILYPEVPVVSVVIAIILTLFMIQRFGTSMIGRSFGPIMLIWFLMLAAVGISQIPKHPDVFAALSPHYAFNLLVRYPEGFWLLGAVFLCTTGAEALYSDLGHCGRRNIQFAWIGVKAALLLNYFGQGAWLLHMGGQKLEGHNPFFLIIPDWFLLPSIILATLAAIIASQALISGSYTLVSEAMRLNFWPKFRIIYPTQVKGQLYIPSINWLLCIGCIGVVLIFRSSSAMEAAYGLAIASAMLMTSLLLLYYLLRVPATRRWAYPVISVFLVIETCFLLANLSKFMHGSWLTLLLAILLMSVMYTWYRARKIKNRYLEFTKWQDHLPALQALSQDENVPKYATHLVFLTSADRKSEIERKITYSLFNKQPKRADTYWFVHIDVLDVPYEQTIQVEALVPDKIYRIDFGLGFRVEPRVNKLFRQALEELNRKKHIDLLSRYPSLRAFGFAGDFRFVVIERIKPPDDELKGVDRLVMDIYSLLKTVSLSEERAFHLDTSLVTVEKVPMYF